MGNLEDSLRQLLAERSINHALDAYCFGMDLRDRELLLRAFHPDAVVRMGGATMTGHEQIAGLVTGDAAARWADVNHFTTNHLVTFQSDTEATGLLHSIVLYVTHEGVYISGAGRYRDRYTADGGEWRIGERDVEIRHFTVLDGAAVHLRHPGITAQWLSEVRDKYARDRAE